MSATGKLVTPARWFSGTPTSESAFQGFHDGINSLLGSSVSALQFREDFPFKPAAALSSAGVMGQFSWAAFAGAPIVNVDDYAPEANTCGFVNVKRDPGAGGTAATACQGNASRIATTGDYWIGMRAKVTAKARLGSLSAGAGFGIGFASSPVASGVGPSFGTGGDELNWWAGAGDGSAFDTGVAATDNTWVVFEIVRSGGRLAFFINGIRVREMAAPTAPSYYYPTVSIVGLNVAPGQELCAVDYFGVTVPRPVTG